jgi:hypothetical protein
MVARKIKERSSGKSKIKYFQIFIYRSGSVKGPDLLLKKYLLIYKRKIYNRNQGRDKSGRTGLPKRRKESQQKERNRSVF